MGIENEVLIVVKNFIFLIELLGFLLLSKWIYEKISYFSFQNELVKKDNLAFCITLMGYMVGVAIILIGVNHGDNGNSEKISFLNMFFIQLTEVATYSILGIFLLLISRIINDKFILSSFSVYKEVIDDQNSGTGVVLFASFVSTALIINASLSGEGTGILSCVIFFLIGQLILILFTKVYQFITPFDIHQEIEEDNVAVGCSFAGTLLATGILVAKGITGEFDNMGDLLLNLFLYTLVGFVLFPIVRIGFDKYFIKGVSLSQELVEDQNIGLGVLEGTIAIIVATAIYFSL